ncbi:carbonic anhydrase [Alteribacillus bidgolensis]|uniref:carbonic anhydrase n=1 Tax=Alteribacillus bidgolensis TaxID=930129 RepID=A0A1G8G137_9BACI|nr:carbonic anhydrase family protein [Alteribacillus bidgolensis]SDH88020.1 carbonic anhydrase [Alteribacillus bidgolensis]
MSNKLIYPFLTASLIFPIGGCQEGSKETNTPNEEEGQDRSGEWSYKGDTGPEHWGDLDPDYAACVDGSEQSPINIEFSQVTEDDQNIESMKIDYNPASFTLVNNGHTVQAESPSEMNRLVIDENEYELSQFHFHTPSEHQFNGEKYDMELHLVHEDKNGKLAVIGVMLQEGEEHEELSEAWENLPASENAKDIAMDEPIDLQALLPEDQNSFHYNGSLTTPPCTEEVHWIIFEQPMEMSNEQIQGFQQIFPDNHRPVQERNDREILKN